MDENKSLADANLGKADRKEEATNQVNTASTGIQGENPKEKSADIKNNQNDQKTASQPIIQSSLNENHKDEKPKVKKKRFHLYHVKNLLKKAHPLNIKAKLEHYRFEYSRILHLARKPTKQEFKELSIMVIIGTFIIGILGFIIQMIIQVI
jgi:protein transport protein SEC61 subunit gamma-like protein